MSHAPNIVAEIAIAWQRFELPTSLLHDFLDFLRENTSEKVTVPFSLAFPLVEAPLETAVFDEAVDLYRLARRIGITVRSSVDCLIAVCAIRNDLTLLHHDRDFDRIARISPLRSRSLGSR